MKLPIKPRKLLTMLQITGAILGIFNWLLAISFKLNLF